MVRRAYRSNPDARIVVTGCYAQMAGCELLDLVDQPVCLVGNAYKHLLVDYTLADDYCDIEMYMTDISKVSEICDLPVKSFRGRTRARDTPASARLTFGSLILRRHRRHMPLKKSLVNRCGTWPNWPG